MESNKAHWFSIKHIKDSQYELKLGKGKNPKVLTDNLDSLLFAVRTKIKVGIAVPQTQATYILVITETDNKIPVLKAIRTCMCAGLGEAIKIYTIATTFGYVFKSLNIENIIETLNCFDNVTIREHKI